MSCTVLMVGEKPSIASSIATILSKGKCSTRKGIGTQVHEFQSTFLGKNADMKVTSVTGHVYSIDFTPQYRSWETTDPATLFEAPTLKEESSVSIVRHLRKEAEGCDHVVLWLDCDREGENICFEVLENVKRQLNPPKGNVRQIHRARFSAITAPDITRAMNNLVEPNYNEAKAVDARQELDLKVGVAFTRFQTRYFQGKYGNLDASLVSYGPCQTPTLGFCVDRHMLIQTFQPEPFWTVSPTIEGSRFDWERGRVFEHEAAILFQSIVSQSKYATVLSVTNKEGKKPRPIPLNTVDLLKICSAVLHMGPHHAMQIAERLYINGYISYPRTESTVYPEHFDLSGTLQLQKNHPVWGDYVQSLIEAGVHKPKNGKDMGDHPPITPMSCVTSSMLGADEWKVYEYITRHFIATISPDCKYTKTKILVDIGGERFKRSGKQVLSAGFTLILPGLSVKDESVPSHMKEGKEYVVNGVSLVEGKTSPPDYLTESELIELMERNGIGTDASISVHINNICERNYVKVEGVSRTLVPTHLGIALVNGYHRIDPDLVLPTVRSHIERQIDEIARGVAQFDLVVKHSLDNFYKKFQYFVSKITKMDELFEASFSPISQTGGSTMRTRCGLCKRYMRLIPLKPTRFYCQTCEETYSLPQNGTIKLYMGEVCPLDGFELVLFSYGAQSKCYPVCPYCYNHPTLEGMKQKMGCNNCPHPSCKHSYTHYGFTECFECEEGTLVLDPNSKPKWRADCNLCNFMLYLIEGAHKISPSQEVCEECSSTKLCVDFHKDKTPLPEGKTLYTGCIRCDDVLNGLIHGSHSRSRHPSLQNRGRGRRGRGRGRGKRRGASH